MSFQLSPHVDKNKIFFVQHSELQDRLDPLFYIALENIKNNIERKAKYQCVNLIQTCSINRGRFGHRPRNDPRFYDGEYPFIQTGDIVEASDSKTQIKYTQTLNELGLKTSKLFHPPKLLFTIAANIGDTAILDYSSCFPDSIVALIPKKDDITLEYLDIYLKLIKPYVVKLAPYSAQRNLNNQQLAQVPIVIPPKEVQEEIVAKMDAAYAAKQQKEAEAQRSLDSIDDYLLSELGIDPTEPEENTIQDRVFFCNLRNVVGRRFDPLYHSGNIYKFIESSIYNFGYISRVTVYMKTGFASGKQDQSNDEQDVIQIRSTNISDEREFVFTKNIYIHKSELLNRKDDILQFGEVLFNNTNSQELVGKSIFFDLENSYFCSNHTTRISVQQDKVNPQYLTHILNLYQRKQVFFKICTNWNNQSGVNVNVLGQVKIPIPPPKKQLEIVDRITAIRTQAKQLRQAAAAELEQAKQEVEAMILGEHGNKA